MDMMLLMTKNGLPSPAPSRTEELSHSREAIELSLIKLESASVGIGGNGRIRWLV